MKTTLSLLLASLALAPAQAQVLRPEAVNGAVLGGIAGGIIGHNSGDLRHNGWRGAAIGAGAGLLIGTIIGESNDRRVATQVPMPAQPGTYVYRETPRIAFYGSYGRGGYGRHGDYYRPSYRGRGPGGYGYGPGYSVGYSVPLYSSAGYYDDDYPAVESGRSDYRASGLILGGLAGAIIGHNSGDLRHNGWRGAAIGATAGYLLGSIAENNARRRAAVLSETVASPAADDGTDAKVATSAIPAATAPEATAPVRPMSAANSLFGRE